MALADQFPEEGFTEKSRVREEGCLRYLLRRTLADGDRIVISDAPLPPGNLSRRLIV
jgi:quinol monooxygenase YgiN